MSNANPGKVKLVHVRLAFPRLTKPESVMGSEPKYNGTFILESDDPHFAENVAAIEAAELAVATEKWGKDAAALLKGFRIKGHVALKDGDTKPNLDGYAGNKFVSFTNAANKPPSLFDGQKAPVSREKENGVAPSDQIFYPGCYVHAILNVWAQDNQYGKKINAALSGLMFAGQGVPFSGSPPATEEDFEEFESAGFDDLA